ncbi:MAG: hypothetical protein QNJ46_03390 [Leptolyngbyaceae cyanobacterium MO_188.B28]|nr:hypothetical protein [Leptolyngbyaceae cyanobacterium MO_188.B28]
MILTRGVINSVETRSCFRPLYPSGTPKANEKSQFYIHNPSPNLGEGLWDSLHPYWVKGYVDKPTLQIVSWMLFSLSLRYIFEIL